MNCFGMLSRDAGHSLVPEPPHMITGNIKPCSLDIVSLTSLSRPRLLGRPKLDCARMTSA